MAGAKVRGRAGDIGRERGGDASWTELGITFVNKFTNSGTKIEFVCSHLIKVCLFQWRGAESVIKGNRKEAD